MLADAGFPYGRLGPMNLLPSIFPYHTWLPSCESIQFFPT
jgi:hypothetical protein